MPPLRSYAGIHGNLAGEPEEHTAGGREGMLKSSYGGPANWSFRSREAAENLPESTAPFSSQVGGSLNDGSARAGAGISLVGE